MLNDNVFCVYRARCNRVYVGVNANVVATLLLTRISVLIDNSSNVLALFESDATVDARVSVGLSSSLVASFNVGALSRVELLVDTNASVDVAFVNALFESSVEMPLKPLALALARVSAVVASQAQASLRCAVDRSRATCSLCSSLRAHCLYWNNRLINANALAALSLYLLCITRFD
ncbi:hypothetical protein TETLON2b_000092 [Candidatus Hodgkinia cicadicola]|nr:hypothetical protein TETLON2b_000092 [Candidatus Hodgkinia cicadicola]